MQEDSKRAAAERARGMRASSTHRMCAMMQRVTATRAHTQPHTHGHTHSHKRTQQGRKRARGREHDCHGYYVLGGHLKCIDLCHLHMHTQAGRRDREEAKVTRS